MCNVRLYVRAGTVAAVGGARSGRLMRWAHGPSERLGFTRGLATRLPRPIAAHRHRSRAFEARRRRRRRPDGPRLQSDPSAGYGQGRRATLRPARRIGQKSALDVRARRRVKPSRCHRVTFYIIYYYTSARRREYTPSTSSRALVYYVVRIIYAHTHYILQYNVVMYSARGARTASARVKSFCTRKSEGGIAKFEIYWYTDKRSRRPSILYVMNIHMCTVRLIVYI